MTLPKQLPLQFEFRANQTFDDFFPGANLEIINHLQKSSEGNGERLVFSGPNPGLVKVIYCKPVASMHKAINSVHFIFPYYLLNCLIPHC